MLSRGSFAVSSSLDVGGPLRRRSVDEALRDGAVGFDPAVSEEGPPPPMVLENLTAARHGKHFISVARGFGEHLPLRTAHEGLTPEIHTGLAGAFVADTIDGGDVDTVGDRVATLDRAPGVVLRGAVGLALGRHPPESRSGRTRSRRPATR